MIKNIDYDKLSYEEAVSLLEEIVEKLNESSTSLDDALALFEAGTKLTSICTKKLNDAKAKIIEIEKD